MKTGEKGKLARIKNYSGLSLSVLFLGKGGGPFSLPRGYMGSGGPRERKEKSRNVLPERTHKLVDAEKHGSTTAEHAKRGETLQEGETPKKSPGLRKEKRERRKTSS